MGHAIRNGTPAPHVTNRCLCVRHADRLKLLGLHSGIPFWDIPDLGPYLLGMGTTIHSAEHRRLVALLQERREKAGLRQSELAERLGRHQSFVSKYENGERRLDLVEVRAICAALDASLVGLIRRWEQETPS